MSIYDFEIVYKKGKQNMMADAFSRKYENVKALLCVISIIQTNWIVEAREECNNDLFVWMIIQKLQRDRSVSYTFVWRNDSLWHKNKLYICKNYQLKQKVLLELNTSIIGGHSGFLKTNYRLKKKFFGKILNLMFKCSW